MDKMDSLKDPGLDVVGYWTELKLEIIKKYAQAYSTILSKQPFQHVYVDAFAGPGINISRATGDFIPGSPLNALEVDPPFREFHLIDLNGDKVAMLKELVGSQPDVHLHHGDCNDVLLTEIFPQVKWEDFRRGLCILDPYKVNLRWEVVETAARMKTIEIFLNFPTMDMNRNILRRNPSQVTDVSLARMRAFWGDDTWMEAAYETEDTLFGLAEKKTRTENVVKAYRKRLKEVAGFSYVPKPVPMRNAGGGIVYHLFFAAHRPVAAKIVTDIFNLYRKRGDIRNGFRLGD